MNYFHLLTEEEVQIICSNYPYKEMIEGFKKYPKYFTAISTFRPQKISEEKGHKLMAENSNSRLVKIMVDHDMAKVASEGAAAKVRMNLAEYLEKGIVK